MSQPPGAYAAGYAKACAVDSELAANYIRHTRIGDPDLDPVMADVADLEGGLLNRFIRAGIEDDAAALKRAPQSLRHFFDDKVGRPSWVDFESHAPAVRAFNLNAATMLVAFVCGVLIEGFSTLISKSFATTGRVLTPESGRRRLMQNNRHLMEVFYPGGLEKVRGWMETLDARPVRACARPASVGGIRCLGHTRGRHADQRRAYGTRLDRILHAPTGPRRPRGGGFQR